LRCSSRHGFSRPTPSAGSTNPYFASIPRWYEQLATLSPVISAQRVAVAVSSIARISRIASRVGCDMARNRCGSVIRPLCSGM
jgi:hypothetical protein